LELLKRTKNHLSAFSGLIATPPSDDNDSGVSEGTAKTVEDVRSQSTTDCPNELCPSGLEILRSN
jgi:hypothetical protein